MSYRVGRFSEAFPETEGSARFGGICVGVRLYAERVIAALPIAPAVLVHLSAVPSPNVNNLSPSLLSSGKGPDC